MTGEQWLKEQLKNPQLWPKGTFCRVEPNFLGTGDGHPDTFILVPPAYFPLELKGDGYGPEQLRPSQRRWHRLNVRAGGMSFLVDKADDKITIYDLRRRLRVHRTEVLSEFSHQAVLSFILKSPSARQVTQLK